MTRRRVLYSSRATFTAGGYDGHTEHTGRMSTPSRISSTIGTPCAMISSMQGSPPIRDLYTNMLVRVANAYTHGREEGDTIRLAAQVELRAQFTALKEDVIARRCSMAAGLRAVLRAGRAGRQVNPEAYDDPGDPEGVSEEDE